MGLNRLPNWESILINEINESKNCLFEYVENDCTTWAAKVIRSYTDLKWKPSWKSKKEAIKLHKSKPMEEQVSDVLGSPIANIMTTQRGDLVQKDTGLNSALGICIGRKVVFLYQKGICYADLKDCVHSWRI